MELHKKTDDPRNCLLWSYGTLKKWCLVTMMTYLDSSKRLAYVTESILFLEQVITLHVSILSSRQLSMEHSKRIPRSRCNLWQSRHFGNGFQTHYFIIRPRVGLCHIPHFNNQCLLFLQPSPSIVFIVLSVHNQLIVLDHYSTYSDRFSELMNDQILVWLDLYADFKFTIKLILAALIRVLISSHIFSRNLNIFNKD